MNGRSPISFFSGNRADLGPLWPVIIEAAKSQYLDTSLIISSDHQPHSIKDCRIHAYDDGYTGDDELAICQRSGKVLGNIGQALGKLRPKCLVILGDRFEALSATQAAVIFKVPIAHICGGDTSNGAFDEYFRNAISIMSDLHFTTNKQSTENLKSMGIHSDKIYEFGHPGIDSITTDPVVSKEMFFNAIGLNPSLKTILVSFHSVTAKNDFGRGEFNQLLNAINEISQSDQNVQFLMTGANTDPFGYEINVCLKQLEETSTQFSFIHTLGKKLFKSALVYCDLFIGNSSSIIYEAPAIGQHALLIGDRQADRAMPDIVQKVQAEAAEIVYAVNHALNTRKPAIDMFFGRKGVSEKIIKKLVDIYHYS